MSSNQINVKEQPLNRNIISVSRENIAAVIDFLNNISNDEYIHEEQGNSNIGAHIRHIIEFYESFLNSFSTGFLDYDDRPRDKNIELSKDKAIKRMGEISNSLTNIKYNNLSKSLEVRESISEDYGPIVQSTFERELVFISSHTTHHLGIIKTIMSLTGRNICDNFGKAPSTIIYEKNIAEN